MDLLIEYAIWTWLAAVALAVVRAPASATGSSRGLAPAASRHRCAGGCRRRSRPGWRAFTEMSPEQRVGDAGGWRRLAPVLLVAIPVTGFRRLQHEAARPARRQRWPWAWRRASLVALVRDDELAAAADHRHSARAGAGGSGHPLDAQGADHADRGRHRRRADDRDRPARRGGDGFLPCRSLRLFTGRRLAISADSHPRARHLRGDQQAIAVGWRHGDDLVGDGRRADVRDRNHVCSPASATACAGRSISCPLVSRWRSASPSSTG